MNAHRQALLVDGLLATLAVVLGVLGKGADGSVFAVGIVALGGTAFVVVLALSEQGVLLETYITHRPLSFLVACGVGVGLWLVVVAGRTVVTAPVASLLLGVGVGLFWYRIVYGLLRPLPERRRQQARLLRPAERSRDGPDPPD